MNNPFNIPQEKLNELIIGYELWVDSTSDHATYSETHREFSIKISYVLL